jgi:hypothetical protein
VLLRDEDLDMELAMAAIVFGTIFVLFSRDTLNG